MTAKLSLLLPCLLFCLGIRAQKIAGGEIYYELIGPQKYLVTAHVYRVCDEAPLNDLNGYVYAAGNIKIPMIFTRTNIKKINDTCHNPCNIQNTSSNPGFEQHTFTATVDFNTTYDTVIKANVCWVRFGIHQDIRMKTTTHDTGYFFLDAGVDICKGFLQNHSPRFSMDPKLLAACYQNILYCPGPQDTMDFDSLAFELASVQSDENTTINYINGFSKDIPMSPYCPKPGDKSCKPLPTVIPPRGFYFDQEVCNINFTPTACTETGSIKFKVKEFRRDTTTGVFEYLGYVCREMSPSVRLMSDNNLPVFIGNNRYSLCSGNKICFNIKSEDYPFLPTQKTEDTVFMFWDHGIPMGKLDIINPNAQKKEAQFCWTTTTARAPEKFTFTVGLYDKQCNANLTTRGFSIKTMPSVRVRPHYTLRACSQLYMESIPVDSLYSNPANNTYTYTVVDMSSMRPVYSSAKRIDSVSLPKGGNYILKLSVNNPLFNCPTLYSDTVSIPAIAIHLAYSRDTQVCYGGTITLRPMDLPTGPQHFQWENPLGKANIQDTMNLLTLPVNFKTKTITIRMTNSEHCVVSDTLTLSSIGAFDFRPATMPIRICKGDVFSITAHTLRGAGGYTGKWYINDSLVNTNDTSLSTTFIIKSRIKLTLSGPNNCSYTDSTLLMPIPLPAVSLGSDTALCYGDSSLRLTAVISPYSDSISYWWYTDSTKLMHSDTFLDHKFNHSSSVIVKVTNTFGCKNEVSKNVTMLPLNPFYIVADSIYKYSDQIIATTNTVRSSFQWFNGRTTRNDTFWAYELGKDGACKIWCMATDSNGCSYTDTVSVFIDPLLGTGKIYHHGFKAYPNPVKDHLSVEVEDGCVLQVFSPDGRLVREQVLTSGHNSIPMGDMAKGIYFAKLQAQTIVLLKE